MLNLWSSYDGFIRAMLCSVLEELEVKGCAIVALTTVNNVSWTE